MSSLAGKTLLSTYSSLLKLEGDTQTLLAGGGTAIQVKTGDNESTPLYLNTDRLGIGTATPSDVLHVVGDVLIEQASPELKFFENDTADHWWRFAADSGYFRLDYDDDQDGAFTPYTTGFAMLPSGNIGIGTVDPNKQLSVNAGSGGQVSINRQDADNAIVADNEIGRISFGGDDPTNNTFQIGAAILAAADGTWASTDCPARLQFYTCDDGSATLDARMTIKEDGNVGIGVTSPSTPLHVKCDTDHFGLQLTENSGDESWQIGIDADGDLNFHNSSGPTPQLVVTDAGYVGIGTTAPAQPLEVAQSATSSVVKISTWSTTDTDHSQIQFHKSSSATIGTVAATAANEDLGSIVAYGADTAPGAAGAAKILFEGDAAPDGDAVPGRISFWTSDAASHQKRMTIDDSGQVGIGVTAPAHGLDLHHTPDAGGYAVRFKSDGGGDTRHGMIIWAGADDGSTTNATVYLNAKDGDGTNIGSVQHKTDGTFGVIATSDARIKKDIVDTKIVGLDVVNNIKIREFTKLTGQFNKAGFIAQELKPVWSQAVVGKEDDTEEYEVTPATDTEAAVMGERMAPMSVDYASLIPPLIKAVQELSAEITILKNG